MPPTREGMRQGHNSARDRHTCSISRAVVQQQSIVVGNGARPSLAIAVVTNTVAQRLLELHRDPANAVLVDLLDKRAIYPLAVLATHGLSESRGLAVHCSPGISEAVAANDLLSSGGLRPGAVQVGVADEDGVLCILQQRHDAFQLFGPTSTVWSERQEVTKSKMLRSVRTTRVECASIAFSRVVFAHRLEHSHCPGMCALCWSCASSTCSLRCGHGDDCVGSLVWYLLIVSSTAIALACARSVGAVRVQLVLCGVATVMTA